VLTINVIGKRFEGRDRTQRVLGDISFPLKPGEIVSLYGPSGIGKTTLLRIIAGLDTQYDGEVSLDGVRVVRPTPRIGMVVQSDVSFGWLTVRENIAFGLRYRKRRGESGGVSGFGGRKANVAATGEAERFAELVGLAPGDLPKYPAALSGGMKQRMAFARALLPQPDVLLLDEPFSALDYESRRSLQEVVLRVRETLGTSFICISHDPEETVHLADTILFVGGSPATIVDHLSLGADRPRDPDSAEFLRLRNLVRSRLRTDQLSGDIRTTPGEVHHYAEHERQNALRRAPAEASGG